jgi:hypothetical protein
VSPILISALVVAGIVILFAIGYINHMVETRSLEKARLRADLGDRIKRARDVSESMPGQLMSPALKLFLSRLELKFAERLLGLDKHNEVLAARAAELRVETGKGEEIAVRNPPQPIHSEAKAKEVRFILENLHSQVTRAAQEHLIPGNEAKQWIQDIRHILVQLHIEFFTNLGQQALQQGRPGQARLAFERGTQYLRKQPDPARYQKALSQLENQLARANAMVLETSAPVEEPSELINGLKTMADEEDWKKKTLYD